MSRTTSRTRRSWRTLAVLPVLTVALGGFLAAPNTATADDDATLQGTWRVTCTISSPQGPYVATTTFVFHADHTLDSIGKPADEGSGFWNSGEGGSISFYVTNAGRPDAPVAGVVQSIHLGKLHGGHFETHAFAFVKVQPGDTTYIGPVDVTTEADKLSDAA